MTKIEDSTFLAEGLRIIEAARTKSIPLRLLGAVAIRLHCPASTHLLEDMNRPITDLDFMALAKHNVAIQDFLEEMGYVPDEAVMRYYGSHRHIWEHPDRPGLKVDIFFDCLRFCHVVDFTKRLELDYPTVTLTDVLLEKMQIVEINAKDLKDTLVMLCEHGLSEKEEPETINLSHLASVLGNDWGFWYTVTLNLGRCKEYLDGVAAFSPEERRSILSRIDGILAHLHSCPKSLKWKLREKIGTKAKWYTEVEEVHRL
ncbi:MAG: hypothetical protein C4551_00345 [Bacillota bacterium]|nr:MAG: hypothetical protein C4551_00345 [Bacillota bacterium]